MHPSTLLALTSFPDQLESHYSAIPEQFKNWTPDSWDGVPSEPFTAIGHLCHVRDIELDGYQVRFHRTLREDNPLLSSLDGMALAVERSYATDEGRKALAAFRQARRQTLTILAHLTPEQFRRQATFEGYGAVSLAGLVHYLCSHDQHHLAGTQWLLGKIESLRS
jgi:DinB superfamily